MATLEKLTQSVGSSLGVDEVERLLAKLESSGDAPCEWHLDLSETQHVQPLAGGRLAAAMRAMARERLTVSLPVDESARRFRVLYRSGLLAVGVDISTGPTVDA